MAPGNSGATKVYWGHYLSEKLLSFLYFVRIKVWEGKFCACDKTHFGKKIYKKTQRNILYQQPKKTLMSHYEFLQTCTLRKNNLTFLTFLKSKYKKGNFCSHNKIHFGGKKEKEKKSNIFRKLKVIQIFWVDEMQEYFNFFFYFTWMKVWGGKFCTHNKTHFWGKQVKLKEKKTLNFPINSSQWHKSHYDFLRPWYVRKLYFFAFYFS